MRDVNQEMAVHIIVHGYVQGVGFRYFTQKTALSLGVVGLVRNQYDGTVEIWGEGQRQSLEHLIRTVRKGPMHSTVDQLDTDWQTPTGKHTSFRIRYI